MQRTSEGSLIYDAGRSFTLGVLRGVQRAYRLYDTSMAFTTASFFTVFFALLLLQVPLFLCLRGAKLWGARYI